MFGASLLQRSPALWGVKSAKDAARKRRKWRCREDREKNPLVAIKPRPSSEQLKVIVRQYLLAIGRVK